MFDAYFKTIKTSGKALLISVIGGRLSEGINFKDELGSCVAVVGMPYPNLMAPEIKAKMKFYDKQSRKE